MARRASTVFADVAPVSEIIFRHSPARLDPPKLLGYFTARAPSLSTQYACGSNAVDTGVGRVDVVVTAPPETLGAESDEQAPAKRVPARMGIIRHLMPLTIGRSNRYLEGAGLATGQWTRHLRPVGQSLHLSTSGGMISGMPSSLGPCVSRSVDITRTKPGLWASRSAPNGHAPSNPPTKGCWLFDVGPPPVNVARRGVTR